MYVSVVAIFYFLLTENIEVLTVLSFYLTN